MSECLWNPSDYCPHSFKSRVDVACLSKSIFLISGLMQLLNLALSRNTGYNSAIFRINRGKMAISEKDRFALIVEPIKDYRVYVRFKGKFLPAIFQSYMEMTVTRIGYGSMRNSKY